MITNEKPYKVGDFIKWGFESCYKCPKEYWCGCSVVDYFPRDCEVLEVRWGDIKVWNSYVPGFSYRVKIEKWNNEVYEEWVPHWRI